jgi:excisionase family DNA binding protein
MSVRKQLIYERPQDNLSLQAINSAEANLMDQSDLMDVPRAAKMLNIKESTLRAWIYRRKIAFVRLNGDGGIRFRRSDVEKLIHDSLVLPVPSKSSSLRS